MLHSGHPVGRAEAGVGGATQMQLALTRSRKGCKGESVFSCALKSECNSDYREGRVLKGASVTKAMRKEHGYWETQ